MPEETNQPPKKTCFVVMGFGKKTDFETGRVLDLDKTYRNIIKHAVEAAGLTCIRADEIVHSGLIDVPMYEKLLSADVVVADLSTSNKNAFYELGVRHALRPFTTVVISEDGARAFPFDINHVAVRKYHHLGDDIGFEEVMRFREELTNALIEILKKDPCDKDSPVYTFINNLTPPAIAAAVREAADKNVDDKQDVFEKLGANMSAFSGTSLKGNSPTHSILMEEVDEAQKNGDWLKAKNQLALMRLLAKVEANKNQVTSRGKMIEPEEDPYLLQRLALSTYKSKWPDEKAALLEAHQVLNRLSPETSNDTETLGLWGAVHKRLWEIEKDIKFLDEAIRVYEKGFFIKNDYYNGINYAFLLNVRAAQLTDPAEAIADFVTAGRVRKHVLKICSQWLQNNPMPDTQKIPENALNDYLKSWYWVKATIGEAYAGLGEEANAQQALTEANNKAPETWMPSSTEDQLKKLRSLLVNPPTVMIKV